MLFSFSTSTISKNWIRSTKWRITKSNEGNTKKVCPAPAPDLIDNIERWPVGVWVAAVPPPHLWSIRSEVLVLLRWRKTRRRAAWLRRRRASTWRWNRQTIRCWVITWWWRTSGISTSTGSTSRTSITFRFTTTSTSSTTTTIISSNNNSNKYWRITTIWANIIRWRRPVPTTWSAEPIPGAVPSPLPAAPINTTNSTSSDWHSRANNLSKTVWIRPAAWNSSTTPM